jgi:hypothetical protein
LAQTTFISTGQSNMTQYATLRIIVSIFGFILVSTDNVHEIRTQRRLSVSNAD